jgi:UDP-N-acetylmuramyl pentapeptide phosphotransferase/UDP-N-acetylglucosamine-1-phosphate transferase
MMGWLQIIVTAIVTFIFSSSFILAVRFWAERKQILDVPNDRSSHKYPVPRGGGLAIVLCTIFGIWIIYPTIDADLSVGALLAFTFALLSISTVSWIDDIQSLANRIRFGVHILAAIIIIFTFGYFKVLPLPILVEIPLGWSGLLLTFFWIVGLTNAYNFMDGIDGIAGGQAVIAGIGWFLIASVLESPITGLISLLIIFSSLGFLLHNWAPAKIFMGDVGSAFLGFTFATLPLMVVPLSPLLPIVGGLMVWPFIFDASYTLTRRLIKGENVFAAHRSHLYQRLVITGLSHSRVTLLYMAFQLTGVLTSFFIIQGWYPLAIVGFILIIVCIVSLISGTSRYERMLNLPTTSIH